VKTSPLAVVRPNGIDVADHDHETSQFLATRGDAVFGRLFHRVNGIGAGTRQADDLSLRALRP